MPPKREAADAAASAVTKKPKSSTFACPRPDCPKSYSSQARLNNHIQTAHEGVKHTCPSPGCPQTFSDKSCATRHFNTVHQPAARHACQVVGCGKDFADKGGLNRHFKSTHQGVKHAYEADNCGKIYGSREALTTHVKSAHQGVRYACQVLGCGKDFADSGGRDEHVKSVHQGVRFACEYADCDKKFEWRGSLTQHINAIHKGVKHDCPVDSCNKIFSSKAGLGFHTQSVHQGIRYFCPFDDYQKVFTAKNARSSHIESCHQGVRHCCPFRDCQKSFTRADVLKIHLTVSHLSPDEEAALLEKKLELQQFLADKEAKGLCSASKSCQNPAVQDSFHCSHHQKSTNIVTSVLNEKREAGKLSANSVTNSDEFALLEQRSKISLDPNAKASLRLLSSGSPKAYFIDTEFVWVGRFLPLDITIMRANGEQVVSTRVDHDISTKDLQDLCPHPISRSCVRKVYGKASKTWGKTPNQIIKICQDARISSDAMF